jgi:CTP-dependent riboflavin kinase
MESRFAGRAQSGVVVELTAGKKLRESYGLTDGSTIEIHLPE